MAEGQRQLVDRRCRRLARRRRRRGPRPGLFPDRQRGSDVRRRNSEGRQPVHGVRRGARNQDGQTAVALSGRPPRSVGRGYRHAAAPLRRTTGRKPAQGARGHARRRLLVPVRPRNGQAAVSGRGSEGHAGQIPQHRCDAALPDGCRQPASGLPLLEGQGAGAVRSRLHRLCASHAEPASGRRSRRADSARSDHADVVQSADRLHLCAGRGPCRPRPPRQRRSMVPGGRRVHRLAARPGRHRRGDGFPHQQDRVEERGLGRDARYRAGRSPRQAD